MEHAEGGCTRPKHDVRRRERIEFRAVCAMNLKLLTPARAHDDRQRQDGIKHKISAFSMMMEFISLSLAVRNQRYGLFLRHARFVSFSLCFSFKKLF